MAVALRAEVDRQPVVSPVKGVEAIEVSVVMPCLNEAETLEACIVEGAAGSAGSSHRGRNCYRR